MKKWIVLILLGFVLAGCADKGIGQNSPPDSDNETVAEDETGTDEGTAADDGKWFDLERLDAEALRQGQLPGLAFRSGSKFADIREQWGEPVEEDYLRGGKYVKYTGEKGELYFFDPEVSDSVTHIQLNPSYALSLDDIRGQLGAPDSDALDEMLTGKWLLVYHFDRYTLYVSGKSEDRNGDVDYLFLKQEEA